jgi:hypothetical protein
MPDKYIIRTNLGSAILIGLIALVSIFVFYLFDQNRITLFILIILIVIFMEYLFSKKYLEL